MTSAINVPTVVAAFAILVALCWACVNGRRKLPPGPPPKPIIGNLLDLPPMGQEHIKYKKWSEEYKSDIIHLKVLGTTIIIINSLEIALDLFENKSSIYSSRTDMPMLVDLMGWDWSFGFAPYGEHLRAHRRLFHKEFSGTAFKQHHSKVTNGVQDLLRRLLDNPKDWGKHLRQQIAATIIDVAYGIEAPGSDPIIDIAEAAIATFSTAAVPGAFLVDTFPFLKYVPEWVPGAGFQRKAREWKKLSQAMLNEPFDILMKAIADGVAKSSFTLRCLQNIDPQGDVQYQESVIKGTAATMYGAGADTSVSLLSSFVLAMVLYPEVQAKAQTELDSVIGKGRLPTLDDEESLPYLTAIMKEILRWQPVTPIGFPHMLSEDDVYKGYSISKGAVIIGNIWAMLHDENIYPDPLAFKPERFLKDGKINPSVRDPELVAFGFGRRICPGRLMGRASIWLTAGCILATFNISKALADDGTPIEPSDKYAVGIVNYPEPFDCRMEPRSKETENLIRAIAEALD